MPKSTAPTKELTAHLITSVEDYLKAIYHLTETGEAASTTDIAQRLGHTAPSVTGMVKRLAEQGLVRHEPYRGAELTAAGRRAALRTVRRHRVLEAYLVACLGFDWGNVHDEAERLEHAVSDDLIERMAQALGNPSVDPHGDPIPAADGTIAEVVYTPLTEMPAGRTIVRRVQTADAERLRYLADIGLVPGAPVTISAQGPFHGPLTLETPTGTQIIGPEIGQLVLCLRSDT